MRRYLGRIVFVAAAAAFVLVMVVLFQRSSAPGEPPGKTLGVVVYGQDLERWRSLELGISQACTELSLEKPVLSVRTAQSLPASEDQLERIHREVKAGVGGLLVAVGDSEALREELDEMALATPMVLVETGTGGTLPTLGADDEAMGRRLAGRLHEEGHTGGIVLLKAAQQRRSAALRYEGFTSEAERLGLSFTQVDLDGPEEAYYGLRDDMAAQKPTAVVALENDTLELAGSLGVGGVYICGIGSSGRVIDLLDRGQIDEVCYQNEFALGYLATLQLAAQMDLAPAAEETGVDYRLVTRDILYTPEVERLVFPIIQ